MCIQSNQHGGNPSIRFQDGSFTSSGCPDFTDSVVFLGCILYVQLEQVKRFLIESFSRYVKNVTPLVK